MNEIEGCRPVCLPELDFIKKNLKIKFNNALQHPYVLVSKMIYT